MKKVILSAFVIVSFVAYALAQKSGIASNGGLALQPNNQNSSLTQSQLKASNTPSGSAAVTNNKYKDGSYTGNSANAYYGNVQVVAVISGGKITDVQFLDYPQDRQTSQEINSQAAPMLKSEAIQVQSANVDIISGATLTSQAFQQSLQSALTQAGA